MYKSTTIKLTLVFLISIILGCQPIKKNEINVSKRPNIVLILSDDQAWTDYGFMGHDVIQTPNLDKLASQSVVFRHGYVPTSLCRPSLMTLATGLYPHQHKITGNDPKGGHRDPAYPREDLLERIDSLPSLPRLLAENGYLTHQSGKWWEGHYSRGGFTHGMTKGQRHGDDGLTIGREGMDTIFNFIELALKEDKPFFLWYAPFLPHTPHNPPERLLNKYSEKGLSESIAKYYAMVEWFDETCGQLTDFIDKKALRDNTLVWYITDNGWIQKPEGNGFDFGSKQTPMEGGVRTPVMLSWPGKLKPKERAEFVTSLDFYPTVLRVAGIEVPEGLPGLDIWEQVESGAPIIRKTIFGEGYGHDMVDKNDPEASLAYLWCIEDGWKLILCYDGAIEGYRVDTHEEMRKEPVRLYNLIEDPMERQNLAEKHPDKVAELKGRIEGWYPPVRVRKLFDLGQ